MLGWRPGYNADGTANWLSNSQKPLKVLIGNDLKCLIPLDVKPRPEYTSCHRSCLVLQMITFTEHIHYCNNTEDYVCYPLPDPLPDILPDILPVKHWLQETLSWLVSWILLALFPGPTQLSVPCSTKKHKCAHTSLNASKLTQEFNSWLTDYCKNFCINDLIYLLFWSTLEWFQPSGANPTHELIHLLHSKVNYYQLITCIYGSILKMHMVK